MVVAIRNEERTVAEMTDRERNEFLDSLIAPEWQFVFSLYSAEYNLIALECGLARNYRNLRYFHADLTAFEKMLGCRVALYPEAYVAVNEGDWEVVASLVGGKKLVTASIHPFKNSYKIYTARPLSEGVQGQIQNKLSAPCEFFVKTVITDHERRRQQRAMNGRPLKVWLRQPSNYSVTPLGGAREVGRSCFLVRMGRSRVVLDCGVGFGTFPFPQIDSRMAKTLSGVVITHAHTDHSGYAPRLLVEGCTASVYMTDPTAVLTEHVLNDYLRVSTKIKNHPPLYTSPDITTMLTKFGKVTPTNTPISIGPDITMTFIPVSHIPGAVAVLLETPTGRLLYTGDFSLKGTRVHQPTTTLPQAEVLLTEVTYGHSQHIDRNTTHESCMAEIDQVLARGGVVIIPTLATRSPEILRELELAGRYGKNTPYPVYVDGSIAQVNAIYRSFRDHPDAYFNHSFKTESNLLTSDQLFFEQMDKATRARLFRHHYPCIVVTTSGRGEGPAASYIAELGKYPETALFFVNYLPLGTVGRAIINGARSIELQGVRYSVNCQRRQFSFSAHADQDELIATVDMVKPKRIIAVHGEYGAMTTYLKKVREKFPQIDSIGGCRNRPVSMIIK